MHAHEQSGKATSRGSERPPVRPVVAGPAAEILALQQTVGNAATADLVAHGGTSVQDVLRAPGRPLAESLREEMETRLGADFTDVRVHTDAAAQRSAAEIGARAYTSGNHVVIGEGGADRHTMAHELTHVIQQRSGPVAGTESSAGLRISDPSDRFERAAEANARSALSRPVPAERHQHPAPAAPVTAVAHVQRVGPGDRRRRAIAREQALTQRYGIRIGPADSDGEHFTNSMLDRIEAALDTLPAEHLGPNQRLVAVEVDATATASTSAYHSETNTVGIVRPVIAGGIRAPGWMYAMMNRGQRWQRQRMDAALLGGLPGAGRAEDRALGIRERRHVMAGVSRLLAHGNLLEWTLRHEVGHAVDAMVQWQATRSGEDRFGGWRIYDDTQGRRALARTVLQRAQFLGVLPAPVENSAINLLARRLDPEDVRDRVAEGQQGDVFQFFDVFQNALPAQDFTQRRGMAMRFIQFMLAQPWTLDSGGAAELDINGRTYQMDHYGTWVSYLTAQRNQHALSNYQFSSPGEWFAEAYAAYYDPESGVRDRLHPQVQAWFAALSGPAPTNAPAGPANAPAAPGPAPAAGTSANG